MLRSRARGYVALICGALSLAVVAAAPSEAHAQKGQTRKTPAKKPPTAPTKKFAAPRTQPADAPAATAPAATRPQPAAEQQPRPSPPATATAPADEANDDAKAAGKTAEPAKTDDAPAAAAGPLSHSRQITLDLAGGVRAFQRHLSYSTDAALMRPYDIDPGAGALAVAAELYPAASVTDTGWANLGITASCQTAIGLTSKYKRPLTVDQQDSYATKSYGFEFGLKYRIPWSSSEVAFAAGYGQQTFSLNLPPQAASNMNVPGVAYNYLRPGVSARFGVSEGFAIFTGLGYLVVFGAGEITSADYFPRATVGGFDGELGVAIEMAKHVEVRPSFGYRGFFYTMNTKPGDPFEVGGAFDQYISLNLQLAYRN